MKAKRIISLMLCVLLALALLPQPALGDSSVWTGGAQQPTQGNGEPGNPYLIGTAEELAWFAQQVNVSGRRNICAKLTGNILLNDISNWQNWANSPPANHWTPIGTALATAYTGVFDGDNHTISGIYIANGQSDYQGLFGYIMGGTVKNLGVQAAYILGRTHVGGISGALNSGGIIQNCFNSGAVQGVQYLGGICGQVYLATASIVGCHNSGPVSAIPVEGTITRFWGGICGGNYGIISGCYNTGTISGYNNIAGGICGYNRTGAGGGVIENSYNAGTVTINGSGAGGICGNNESIVRNVYNRGVISIGFQNGNVGGICASSYIPTATITYGYNTGNVFGDTIYKGAICGNNGGTISDLYYSEIGIIGVGYGSGTSVTTVKPSAAFSSGEVAYLLRTSGGAFGQDIGADELPVFLSSNNENAVYKLTYMKDNTTVHAAQYYNSGDTVSADDVENPESDLGDFAGWDTLPTEMPAYDVTAYATYSYTVGELATPTNLTWDTAIPGKAKWGTVDHAAGYAAQLYKNGTAEGSEVSIASGTEYDFTTAIAALGSGSYTFKVRAVGDGTNYMGSGLSEPSPAYNYYTVPTASQNLSATPGNGQIALSWAAPTSNGGSPITGYEVSSDGSNWTDVGDVTAYTVTGLANGQNYTLSVRAVNSVGAGTEASVTATPQAGVTFHTITASAGSGGSITPSGAVSVAEGGSQTFFITPGNDYRISSVTVDNVDMGRISSHTFTGVNSGHTISATFRYTGDTDDTGGGIPLGGGTYPFRTLTDSATGITVSGSIHRNAKLTVNDVALHNDGACDEIRQRMNDENYTLLLSMDISLSRGFIAPLTITLPVGTEYNGLTITILHCNGGTLETYTATVADGKATFTVTGLSPFAAFLYAPGIPLSSPKTGGGSGLVWLLPVVFAAAMLGGFRRRRLRFPHGSARG